MRKRQGHEVGEEELLAKINWLYRGTRLEEVLKEWETLKESSDGTIVDRMFYLSELSSPAHGKGADPSDASRQVQVQIPTLRTCMKIKDDDCFWFS